MTPSISVIIPTHNPDPVRLRRTLDALQGQTLARGEWEAVLVDNASSSAVQDLPGLFQSQDNLRLVREPILGLSQARRCGFESTRGEFAVMVDDDNVLAPDYLERVIEIFRANPRLGAIGGRSVPEFESAPQPWVREFDALLACRDLGESVLTAGGTDSSGQKTYPQCAPIGAGMALRREAVDAWLRRESNAAISDRRGNELTSGGDNDIVLCALEAGWEVGYFPALSLTHLIPAKRTSADYLARLNEAIQRSWVRVLGEHGIFPWPAISTWSAPLRTARAWWRTRAWSGDAARVRYRGLKGRFLGQADLRKNA